MSLLTKPHKSGKVRDLYDLGDHFLMVASNRISCFDCILAEEIPLKGAVLNLLSRFWFERCADILPNHYIRCPDAQSMEIKKLHPIPIEMVVRGYASGSLWRSYQKGQRVFCGFALPDHLTENSRLLHPIITPTTKSEAGHDENTSADELSANGTLTRDQWSLVSEKALALYARGHEVAHSRGLILMDTKYEFGWDESGILYLIDEVHTPDSSRYCRLQDWEKGQVKFLDKELVRQWLRAHGFTGEEGKPPSLPPSLVEATSLLYQHLYQTLTGQPLSQTLQEFQP